MPQTEGGGQWQATVSSHRGQVFCMNKEQEIFVLYNTYKYLWPTLKIQTWKPQLICQRALDMIFCYKWVTITSYLWTDRSISSYYGPVHGNFWSDIGKIFNGIWFSFVQLKNCIEYFYSYMCYITLYIPDCKVLDLEFDRNATCTEVI